MSFRNYKDKIDEGDTVILYISNNVVAIEVKPLIKNKRGELMENVYQTTFGALKVRSLIGAEYGSRVSLAVYLCMFNVGYWPHVKPNSSSL